MKASMFIKSTLALTGLLAAISACSGKKEAGSGGGSPAAPVQPTTISGLGDSFDNMRGANPAMSIQGQAIRNANFSLIDASGATPGFYVNVSLSFDANGMLSANAVIDSAAFNANQNGAMDPWSSYNQPRNTQGLITYRAINIPYNYNQRTGSLTIRNFVAGSSIRTQSVTSTTFNPSFPQQTTANGRKAILIGDVKISKKSLLKGLVTLRGSTSSGKMTGYLTNLSDFEAEGDSRRGNFHPMTHGFEIGCPVKLASGELVAVPEFVYTNVNGVSQQTQRTREEWLPGFFENAMIYSEPVLDPRLRQ